MSRSSVSGQNYCAVETRLQMMEYRFSDASRDIYLVNVSFVSVSFLIINADELTPFYRPLQSQVNLSYRVIFHAIWVVPQLIEFPFRNIACGSNRQEKTSYRKIVSWMLSVIFHGVKRKTTSEKFINFREVLCQRSLHVHYFNMPQCCLHRVSLQKYRMWLEMGGKKCLIAKLFHECFLSYFMG